MRRLRARDGQTVTRIDLQHHVNVGDAITRIDDMIGTDDVLGQQLIEHRDLAISGGSPNDRVDLARRFIPKLSAEDVICRNNAFQSRVNYLNWSGRENVEIEEMTIDSGFENLVKKLDVAFEANALSDLMKMLFPDLRLELWIVQQQVGELRSLLDEINLRHSLGLALKFSSGNADEFSQHVARIIEGERLIEVAREDVAL